MEGGRGEAAQTRVTFNGSMSEDDDKLREEGTEQPHAEPTALAKQDEKAAEGLRRDQVTKLLGMLVDKADKPEQLIELSEQFLGALNKYDGAQIELERKRNEVAFEAERRRNFLALELKERDPDAIQLRKDSMQRRWLRGTLVGFAILGIAGGLGCLSVGAGPFALLLFCVATFCTVMVSIHGTDRKLNVDDTLRALKAAGDLILPIKSSPTKELPPAPPSKEE